MLQSPVPTSPKMLIMKLSHWTPNLEKNVYIEVVKTIFPIGYDFLYIILFGPNLIIRLRFDVLPTTEISVIFLHISVENETPTQVKLIMKMDLTANWYDYVSNLMCCFSCFIVCPCFCWGWTNGGSWCYCFTKQRMNIWNLWLGRPPELFIQWGFLIRKFRK